MLRTLIITLLGAIILGGSFLYLRSTDSSKSENYLVLGRCALWTKDFEIAHRYPGSYCDIIPGTGVVARNGDGFMLLNYRNDVVYQVRGIFHHNLYYSDYHRLIFMISASDYRLANGDYGMISNIEGYNPHNGKLEFRWDGSALVEYFQKHDIAMSLHDRDVESFKGIGIDWMESKGLKSKRHLFMANNLTISHQDIPKANINRGDLILNIIYPSGFVVLDKDSQKIKKWFSFYGREVSGIESHHPTLDGENVVVFLNSVKDQSSSRPASKVASYSLIDGKLNWIWPKDSSTFHIHSPIQGGILKVGKYHYLVYSTFDKNIISLDTRDFSFFYLLHANETEKLMNIKDGKELVDLKLVPYSELVKYRHLFLEMLEYETFTPDFYLPSRERQ